MRILARPAPTFALGLYPIPSPTRRNAGGQAKAEAQIPVWRLELVAECRPAFPRAVDIAPAPAYPGRARRGTDRRTQIIDLATDKELPELADQFTPYLAHYAFSGNATMLATIGPDRAIRIWDTTTRKKIRDFKADGLGAVNGRGVQTLALSRDGRRLFVGDANRVRIWDTATGKPLDAFGGFDNSVRAVAWFPDGKQIVACSLSDMVAGIWDAATGRKMLDLVGHEKGIEAVTLSPDGSLVATVSQDGTARLWNTSTGKEVHAFVLGDKNESALAFTPDGKFLITGGEGRLEVWDIPGRNRSRVIPVKARRIRQIIVFGNGQQLLVREQDVILRVLDFPSGRERFSFDGDRDSLTGFPPEQRYVSSCSAAVSPDEQRLAFAGRDGNIRIASLPTGKQLFTLDDPSPYRTSNCNLVKYHPVTTMAFSPDGRTLSVTFGDAEIRNREPRVYVYEAATGSERFHFTGHSDIPLGLAFSPDGTRLCSYGGDRTALIWDVAGARSASPLPKSLDAAWADLMSPEAGKGFAAIWYMTADPAGTISHVRERLKPVPPVDRKTVAGLIDRLGSEDFQEREKASRELSELAPGAINQIREAAGKTDSAEARNRLAPILARETAERLTGERLRVLRAVEVLERIGNPAADKLLHELAAGAADAVLTRDATEAVRRMGKGK
jgi:WD40 repeat protein